ncbi:hypothetical protein RB593_001973 [Gaeumannomyces tritici]
MKIPRLALAVAALAVSAVHAWLPGAGPEKRSIVDLDGFSLFNGSHGGGSTGRRWLSASGKLRGVNLGSLFIVEPWMMWSEWAAGMGCEVKDKNSEFDCMTKLGQSEGDRKFKEHWGNFIKEADFNEMIDSGLNTVRIPLGYWMMEEIVYWDSEHFPRAIRDTERSLGITANNYLHIQMMNSLWGPEKPGEFLSSNYFLAYDDHRYLKWTFPNSSPSDYISISCRDNRAAPGEADTIVGEWSISAPDAKENDGEWAKSNTDFYKKWFAAQVIAYERHTLGWVFWSWKKEGDYRWSYQDAVRQGIVPRDLNSVANSGVCNGV